MPGNWFLAGVSLFPSIRSFNQWIIYMTKSAISDHVARANHIINWEEANIFGKEHNKKAREIKEAIEIRRRGAKTLNRKDTYLLSHKYDPLIKRNLQGNGVLWPLDICLWNPFGPLWPTSIINHWVIRLHFVKQMLCSARSGFESEELPWLAHACTSQIPMGTDQFLNQISTLRMVEESWFLNQIQRWGWLRKVDSTLRSWSVPTGIKIVPFQNQYSPNSSLFQP